MIDLQFCLSLISYAEVVKLANTLRSGRSGLKQPLWVQLPPSARERAGERTIN